MDVTKILAELKAERASLVSQVNPGVLKRYENARKNRRGIGITEAIDGRCTLPSPSGPRFASLASISSSTVSRSTSGRPLLMMPAIPHMACERSRRS